jgi:hypothetical protein
LLAVKIAREPRPASPRLYRRRALARAARLNAEAWDARRSLKLGRTTVLFADAESPQARPRTSYGISKRDTATIEAALAQQPALSVSENVQPTR